MVLHGGTLTYSGAGAYSVAGGAGGGGWGASGGAGGAGSYHAAQVTVD